MIKSIREQLGNTDLDIIDLLLKDKISPRSPILDAGCGEGRNMTFFVKNDYPVWGIDSDPLAVQYCRYYCKSLNSRFDAERIMQEKLEHMLFPPGFFGIVFCINVMHDYNREQRQQMLNKISRVLQPGGLLLLKMLSECFNQSELLKNFEIATINTTKSNQLAAHTFIVGKKR